MELYPASGEGLPACPVHSGSLVRRYRAYGPDGPAVYPQCVPANEEEPHLLVWAEPPTARAAPSNVSVLSLPELGVLDDAMHGMTVTESAANRSKGPETVKSQRKAILLKLGARNMAQAVGIAVHERLVEHGPPRSRPRAVGAALEPSGHEVAGKHLVDGLSALDQLGR